MLNSLTREITLAIQARSGTSVAVVVWLAVVALAAFTAFAFLCVGGYAWFAVKFGSVFAGLIMAGIFAAIALISLLISALIRRRVRERAILARAAKAHSPSWLLDPKLLGVAVEAGRTHRLAAVDPGCAAWNSWRRSGRAITAIKVRTGKSLEVPPPQIGGNASPAPAKASRAMRESSCIWRTRASAEANVASSRIKAINATSIEAP